MEWPWVSRLRLTECEQRLEKSEAERLRLLDALLGGDRERAQLKREVSAAEALENEQAEEPESGKVEQFTTPFDRLHQRFRNEHAGGKRPAAQYRARA